MGGGFGRRVKIGRGGGRRRGINWGVSWIDRGEVLARNGKLEILSTSVACWIANHASHHLEYSR